ncbi:MAG: hypothetical protein KKE43_00125 [Actinobacteria bacterium]|nr:hypothetical protein [Actinomycetota bacterium]
MTKINLLPPERIKAKKAPAERSLLWLVIALPLIVLVVIGFWYFSLNSQMSSKNEALEAAKTELSDIQAKNQQLEQYKARQEEISRIESAAVTALQDRVYWARILNNIAIMCPTDVWLVSLSCAQDGVTFSGFALQCPNRDYCGYGIYPHYPDYRPIAGWLDRMAQIEEFATVWLSGATPVFEGATCNTPVGVEVVEPTTGHKWYEDPYCVGPCAGTITHPPGQYTCFVGDWLIQFDSTATLDMKVAVAGYQGATEENDTTPTDGGTGTTETTPADGGDGQ